MDASRFVFVFVHGFDCSVVKSYFDPFSVEVKLAERNDRLLTVPCVVLFFVYLGRTKITA